jgi:hypothetical protein
VSIFFSSQKLSYYEAIMAIILSLIFPSFFDMHSNFGKHSEDMKSLLLHTQMYKNLFLIYRTNIEKVSPSKNPANNTIGEIK